MTDTDIDTFEAALASGAELRITTDGAIIAYCTPVALADRTIAIRLRGALRRSRPSIFPRHAVTDVRRAGA